jgi:hypothetical protein
MIMGWETIISSVAGGLLGKLVMGSAKTPKTDVSAANSEVDTAATKSKRARTALLETDPTSNNLMPGMVGNSRDSLLGN